MRKHMTQSYESKTVMVMIVRLHGYEDGIIFVYVQLFCWLF